MSDKMKTAWFNEATGEYFLPKVRFVYPRFLKAEINTKFPDNDPKFSGLGLVPKDANIDVVVQAIAQIAAGLWGADWKKKGDEDAALAVKRPIKKTANNEKIADYAEAFPAYVSVGAFADQKPVIFGPDLKPYDPMTHGEIYGGRWGIIAVKVRGPKAEKKNINRFVALDVTRIQLLDHDEPIATGRIGTAEGFEAISGVGAAPSGGNGSADDLF